MIGFIGNMNQKIHQSLAAAKVESYDEIDSSLSCRAAGSFLLFLNRLEDAIDQLILVATGQNMEI